MIAKEKAVKNAKLNITKVLLGCGSSECACREKHSIPFVTTGRSGSVRVTLIPAPKGVGACTADDIKTIIRLAGIKDVWSKVIGQTGTRVNLGYATFDALRKLNLFRYNDKNKEELGI